MDLSSTTTETFSIYFKATLDKVDFKLWVNEIIPNFEQLTEACHCQHEFQTETRCQGHLASGNLDNIISNPIILDRLKRGPMFRETTNGDFNSARAALKATLQELFDRHKKAGAHKWITSFLQKFDAEAQQLKTKDQNGEIDLQALLFPTLGRIAEHQLELDAFLKKYVILPADKCRGNYFVICKNLYIKQCVNSLHQAPEYQQMDISKEDLTAQLLQEISGLIHHSQLSLLLDEGKSDLPYFYTLPKPHKSPVGWRPVAATHRSILALPQRILTQALGVIMKTLKEFHAKEFQETGIRRFWVVENSLDIVLSLPEVLTSMYSSDIDSMYQKMNKENAIKSTAEELQRVATITGADSFFVVIGYTSLGNHIDQCFWFNTDLGLDPTDGSIPSTKDRCSKGEVYPLQNIINLLVFLVRNSYVTLGNSIHHQINGIPQGGHSSGFLANLTCHSHERKWVDKYPFHSLQYSIFRYMDDFRVTNTDYFEEIYRDIYPHDTGIRLVPNRVKLKEGRLLECKILDILVFVDSAGVTHVTLYDNVKIITFLSTDSLTLTLMSAGRNQLLRSMERSSDSSK
jgi:hypothetical protein